MWITLYTDASYCPSKNNSSWAMWAKSNQGKVKNSGMCPIWVTDNNAAEIFAVYVAIKALLKKWNNSEEAKVDGIYVISDSKTVCEALKFWLPNKKPNKNKVIRRAESRLHSLLKEANIKVRISHIKSHSKYNEDTMNSKAGHYLNASCDEMAKKMRENYKLPENKKVID